MKTNKSISISKHFILTDDSLIRTALRKDLEKACEKDTNTKIIEELGITHGAARIDIAIVNGAIHGYELKSDIDTLKRLPNQIKIYNSVLDKITLVVGKNHLHEATKIVPNWWGITVAKIINAENTVSFCNIREAGRNPNPDSMAIAALLWRDEALKILEKINKADGVRSKPRSAIYRRLVDELDKKTLGINVRECLRTRTNWRSDVPPILSGG